MENGQIVKLFIPHFRKERYFLVYQIIKGFDFVLLNITGRDKRDSANLIITQFPLDKEISPNVKSLVNLNTKIFIEYKLFFDLISKLPQQNKEQSLPKLSEKELSEIKKGVDNCFSDELFQGNRYEVRVK